MNKEELKKKISDIPIKLSTEEILTGQVEEVIVTVLDLIDQLDEPADEKPETVSSVFADYLKAVKRLKEVLDMEVVDKPEEVEE